MKLTHDLPTELDATRSLVNHIDDYLALYEEELITDQEYGYIEEYFTDLYNLEEQRMHEEMQDIYNTYETLRNL